MSSSRATLHMLCGKIAAGKSSLAAELAKQPSTIVLSEDALLRRLFQAEIASAADFLLYSGRLRAALEEHIEQLLRLGVSVVLDFHANTVASRAWMRSLFERAGADHRLHFIDVPEDICKERLRRRNAAGMHDFAASDAEFDLITSYFVPPAPDEGFQVVRH